jgi:protease II
MFPAVLTVCFSLQVSPNHKLFAVAEDFTGDEVYTIRVVDIPSGQPVGKLITGSTEQIEWAADSETLFYITQDQVHRPFKCSIRLGDIGWIQTNLRTLAFIMRRMRSFILISKSQRVNNISLLYLVQR